MKNRNLINFLSQNGFTETSYREKLWRKARPAYEYEKETPGDRINLVVFESDSGVFVLSEMTGVGLFKHQFGNSDEAISFLSDQLAGVN